MDFTFLNTIYPCLISVLNINKLNCSSPGTSYGKRTVKHFELDYITWGEGYIVTDGKEIPARGGTLFFRRPGMVVEGYSPYHCYYVVFDMSINGNEALLKESVHKESNVIHPEFPIITNVENTAYLEDLFIRLYNEFILQRDIIPFITRTYLMQILLYMHNQWVARDRFENLGTSFQFHHKKIQTVRNNIDNNYNKRFSLDKLAGDSGYSRYFFCRIFKEITGESPINYINKCRINNAKRMILETDKSINEILLECGFENDSHFFKLFKKHVDISPLNFRKTYNEWRL